MTRLLFVTAAGFLAAGCGERDAARAPDPPRAEAPPPVPVNPAPAGVEARPESPPASRGVAHLQVPVTLHSDPELDPCAWGAVRGSAGDSVDVRSGPGAQYPVVDRLATGHQLALCAVGGEWEGVIYPPQGNEELDDCGAMHESAPEPLAYRGPCKSGWVLGERIELLAG